MTKIILASASPRRKQILENAGLIFEVHASSFDEKLKSHDFSKEIIEQFAYNKAKDVAEKFPEDIVISADTVVVFDDKIFMKPKDKEDAFGMLKSLSGKTHFVQTSICMLCKDKKLIKSIKTNVTFNDLSDELINYYIENYKPFDKAGAYGIQELPEGFVKSIDGDFENVMGISSYHVKEMLRTIKEHEFKN